LIASFRDGGGRKNCAAREDGPQKTWPDLEGGNEIVPSCRKEVKNGLVKFSG